MIDLLTVGQYRRHMRIITVDIDRVRVMGAGIRGTHLCSSPDTKDVSYPEEKLDVTMPAKRLPPVN